MLKKAADRHTFPEQMKFSKFCIGLYMTNKDLPVGAWPVNYKDLIARSLDIITIADEQGNIQYESPGITHVLGWEPEELIGGNVLTYIHEEDQAEAISCLNSLQSGPGKKIKLQFRFRCSDGNWRDLETIGQSISAGDRLMMLFNSRDITDTINLQNELVRSNQILQSVFDTHAAFLSLSRESDGRFIMVNNAWESILGHSASESIGKTSL